LKPDCDGDNVRLSGGSFRRKLEKPVCRNVADASESEAWSEPDRSVSLARMGCLESVSATPLRLSKCADSSGSSEETLNENNRNTGWIQFY